MSEEIECIAISPDFFLLLRHQRDIPSSVAVFCSDISEIGPLHSKKMQQIHFLENTIVLNTIKYILNIIEHIVFNSEFRKKLNKH